MSNIVLTLNQVGKSYRNYPSHLRRFCSWFGFGAGAYTDNWVLRDITFGVAQGEAVGIVGKNGAGKSTLLKLVTGTVAPTTGTFAVSGRVSAILELGMGFNDELTGRQNAIHACGLMGHQLAEILEVLPDIEEFVEIGPYFNQPMRTYSTGMQARLAFAVATAFRPEILIVDEVLSVGDAYFQHKSFDRIRRFREDGTTLLMVSHERSAILSLCDRVVLLDGGELLLDGPPEEVMDYYNALVATEEEARVIRQASEKGNGARIQTTSGSGEAEFVEIKLCDQDGDEKDLFETGTLVNLSLQLRVHRDVPELVVGFLLRDRLGRAVYGTNTHYQGQPLRNLAAGARVRYDFTFTADLGPGTYSVVVAAHQGRAHIEKNYEWRDMALVFEVVNRTHAEFIGCNWLDPQLAVEVTHE